MQDQIPLITGCVVCSADRTAGVANSSVVLRAEVHLLRNPHVQAQFQLLLLLSTTSFPHVREWFGVHGPSTECIDTFVSSSASFPIANLSLGSFVHGLLRNPDVVAEG